MSSTKRPVTCNLGSQPGKRLDLGIGYLPIIIWFILLCFDRFLNIRFILLWILGLGTCQMKRNSLLFLHISKSNHLSMGNSQASFWQDETNKNILKACDQFLLTVSPEYPICNILFWEIFSCSLCLRTASDLYGYPWTLHKFLLTPGPLMLFCCIWSI